MMYSPAEYEDHYRRCCRWYMSSRSGPDRYRSVYDLDVNFSTISIPRGICRNISMEMSESFGRGALFRSGHAVYATERLPTVQSVVDIVRPILEREVYHSAVQVEWVTCYRNDQATDDDEVDALATSWQWHFDNVAGEFVKVIVYLDDVAPGGGEFFYAIDKVTRKPVIKTSHRIRGSSRLKEADVLSRCDQVGIYGPTGTSILFCPNVIHRASRPGKGMKQREVVSLVCRPCLRPVDYKVLQVDSPIKEYELT